MTKERGETLCETMIAAMAKHMGYAAEPWPELDEKLKAMLADAERAVRNAALEEAAKIADAEAQQSWPVDALISARYLANKLRAMKEPEA